MDQSKMEKIMELLKAISRERKTHDEEMMAKMNVNHKKMMASLKRLNATTMAWRGEMKACREVTEACEGRTEAFLERPWRSPGKSPRE
jgi:hypothetical protein